MISAHVGGVPVEEMLTLGGPPLLVAIGAIAATARARLRALAGRRERRR